MSSGSLYGGQSAQYISHRGREVETAAQLD